MWLWNAREQEEGVKDPAVVPGTRRTNPLTHRLMNPPLDQVHPLSRSTFFLSLSTSFQLLLFFSLLSSLLLATGAVC